MLDRWKLEHSDPTDGGATWAGVETWMDTGLGR